MLSPSKIKNSVMKSSRAKKLEHFYALSKPGDTVLDVGVSPEKRIGPPARNYFLKTYRYEAKTYTGLGVQDLTGMENLFPGKRFITYPGREFPFPDKKFDWVFSNAVIEHVGDTAAQVLFLNEMMRVAKRVFFTTPNKFFPVETHTNALFLHWSDSVFFEWCRKHKPWATPESLNLLDYSHLKRVIDRSNVASYEIFKNRLGGVPMTFTVVCSNTPVSR